MKLPTKWGVRLGNLGEGAKGRVRDPQVWINALDAAIPWITVVAVVLIVAWGGQRYVGGRWIRMGMGDYAYQTETISKNPPRKTLHSQIQEEGLFVDANPFKLAAPPRTAAGAESSIDSFTLVGTLPNIGAWIANEEGTKLVLKNQSIAGFVLADVQRDKIYMTKDNNVYPLLLYLSAVIPPPAPKTSEIARPGVERADEGKDGAMSRELLNKLLQNPYDELSKMRLIPRPASGDVPGGMEVANVAPSSVLAELGVQGGDTIQSLNGITINNMGDVANAINSLMSGSRVDVRLQRGGQIINLGYVVR